MKVLLVYVNVTARRFFPTNLTAIAGMLEKNDHKVEVFDTSFYKEAVVMEPRKRKEEVGIYKPVKNPRPIEFNTTKLMDDFEKKIKEFSPGIIGFSCMSIEYPLTLKLAKYVKDNFPAIRTIIGGIHPTIAPNEVLRNKFVDIICVGEGELALSELCNMMDAGTDFTNIKNLWFKKGDSVIKNNVRDYVDLNQLPIPNWDYYSLQHIYGALDGRMWRMGPVESSRGCPYSCTYCINHILQNLYCKVGKKYHRAKTPEKWIAELKNLKERYNVEMFYVLDETFLAMPTDSLRKIADLYKNEVNIPFFIQTSPLSVTEEKVKLLKEMGCYLVTMGIENGNPEIRDKILKRPINDETIINAFKIFKKYGIKASSFNMVGVPFETRQDFFKTVELNRKCRPDTLAASIFIPYKGTFLRQVAIENGFFHPSEEEVYPTDFSLLNMPQFKPEEIRGLFRTFAPYCRLPKFFYPLIIISEKENPLSLFVHKLLLKLVQFIEWKL